MMAIARDGSRRGNHWRLLRWGLLVALLLLPAVAMRWTREVNWTAADFAVAAALLLGGGAVYEVIVRLTPPGRRRAGSAAVLVLAVALIWAQGAVGVF